MVVTLVIQEFSAIDSHKPTFRSFSDFDKCVGHLALLEVADCGCWWNGQPQAKLFSSQDFSRIYESGPPRRQKHGGKRYDSQHRADATQCHGIPLFHAKKQAAQQSRRNDRTNESQSQPGSNQPPRLAQHQSIDRGALGTECDAHTDFAATLAYRVCDDPVESDHTQNESRRRKPSNQPC